MKIRLKFSSRKMIWQAGIEWFRERGIDISLASEPGIVITGRVNTPSSISSAVETMLEDCYPEGLTVDQIISSSNVPVDTLRYMLRNLESSGRIRREKSTGKSGDRGGPHKDI